MILNKTNAEDVAAASAAYTYHLLPEMAKMGTWEGFRTLYGLFHTAIVAYVESQSDRAPKQEPSQN